MAPLRLFLAAAAVTLAFPASASAAEASFGAPTLHGAGTHPLGLAVGDVNGDRHADVVTANSGAHDVSLLLGTGDGLGGFEAPVRLAVGANPAAVAIGDIDGDGRPDLVAANANDTVSVLLGDG